MDIDPEIFNDEYKAPLITNERTKIIWSADGISEYQNLLDSQLDELTSRWCDPNSPACMSVLLAATNSILSSAATLTNKYIKLGKCPRPKPKVNRELTEL